MKLETLRHSLSHILAYAIQELYPETKFGIGPAIEQGFYYDFDLQSPISPDDLPKIEKKMKEIIKKDLKFEIKEISKIQAIKLFKTQPYKIELIKELPGSKVSIYKIGNFVDLCKGPHLKSTKEIPADSFKLEKIAGAYWKGQERNPMLTRIYGTAWENKKELDSYLEKIKQAEERDHRVLGKKLGLFMFDQEIGAGLPLWMPKGTTLVKIIEDYLYKELNQEGYEWVRSSHIANLELWKTSGHWDFYKENLYSPIEIDNVKYLLKPMNCPFHIKIYQSKIRSYKDLPIKLAELGTVYRYEKSGVLHGLTRVRGFTQDDAHIWCAKEQLNEEITKLTEHGFKMLKDFGFGKDNLDIYLATMPKKHIGDEKIWKKATNALKQTLNKLKVKYEIDEGGGAFYGPKIDIKIKDSLGRPWQCTTIQVDFNLPEKFNVNYINKNGRKEQSIMIHRALLGAVERFIGVLIEHYAGAFPLWLSPVQISIIPISEKHLKYAKEVAAKIKKQGFRIEIQEENETLSKKIRNTEMQKIPYVLVVGDKEEKEKTISIRSREKGNIGEAKIDDFIAKIKKQEETKK
ncbi:threonine--tRNA ligase [Patescibacteria group bacterium]|nr:threonine--tRNA ligase [Patescibacteria group bacterium]